VRRGAWLVKRGNAGEAEHRIEAVLVFQQDLIPMSTLSKEDPLQNVRLHILT
jgi:hypothetical protein